MGGKPRWPALSLGRSRSGPRRSCNGEARKTQPKPGQSWRGGQLPAGQVLANKWIVLDLGLPRGDSFDYGWTDRGGWRLGLFFPSSSSSSSPALETRETSAQISRPAEVLVQRAPDVELKPSQFLRWARTSPSRLGGEGEGEKERSSRDDEISSVEWEERTLDWHCVTGWSARNVKLLGLPVKLLLDLVPAEQDSSWTWLVQVSADGYTTPVHRDDIDDSAFFAVGMLDPSTGERIVPLPKERGTFRLVFPNLFGWKSTKCVTELHFLPHYVDGFWEKLGCNRRGRWGCGERWASDSASAGPIWTLLTGINDLWRRVFGQRVWVAMMTFGALLVQWWARLGGFFASQAPATAPSSSIKR